MKEIDISELILNYSDYKNHIILDVREPLEFRGVKVKDSFNFPLSHLNQEKKSLSSLDKTKQYLVYCKAGIRSANFSEKMKREGFSSINLIIDWNRIGDLNKLR